MKNQTTVQKEQLPNSAKQTLELIAIMTYGLKSQLNSINTSVKLLAEKLAKSHDDFETKLIANIIASHHYLEARTSELLALVKLQVDGFHLELELTNIDTIVHRVADRLTPIIKNRKQSLTLNLTPNTKQIIADSLRIEQVLHYLLSNASNSTPTGGNISISTDKQDGYIVVKVKDNGPFMPNLEHHETFQSYYWLTGDKDTEIHGTALGLTLCKHLVELHGGRTWEENEGNHGNIFALTLPLTNN